MLAGVEKVIGVVRRTASRVSFNAGAHDMNIKRHVRCVRGCAALEHARRLEMLADPNIIAADLAYARLFHF